ncbi:MAG: hypothetical protein P4L39_06970 [Humidesulfovibrio sp.]|nr:hypothetical protein [Humidesulfovibrio sp.]
MICFCNFSTVVWASLLLELLLELLLLKLLLDDAFVVRVVVALLVVVVLLLEARDLASAEMLTVSPEPEELELLVETLKPPLAVLDAELRVRLLVVLASFRVEAMFV